MGGVGPEHKLCLARLAHVTWAAATCLASLVCSQEGGCFDAGLCSVAERSPSLHHSLPVYLSRRRRSTQHGQHLSVRITTTTLSADILITTTTSICSTKEIGLALLLPDRNCHCQTSSIYFVYERVPFSNFLLYFDKTFLTWNLKLRSLFFHQLNLSSRTSPFPLPARRLLQPEIVAS